MAAHGNADLPLEQAVDEPVHASHDVPAGGEDQAAEGGFARVGGAGSTDRNATDEGAVDSSGVPSGGRAGAVGG